MLFVQLPVLQCPTFGLSQMKSFIFFHHPHLSFELLLFAQVTRLSCLAFWQPRSSNWLSACFPLSFDGRWWESKVVIVHHFIFINLISIKASTKSIYQSFRVDGPLRQLRQLILLLRISAAVLASAQVAIAWNRNHLSQLGCFRKFLFKQVGGTRNVR